MISQYKKGESVAILTRDNTIFYGLIYKISDKSLVLAHNFTETKPIDSSEIKSEDIIKTKKIKPKELNSL